MTPSELLRLIRSYDINGKTLLAMRTAWEVQKRILASIPPFLHHHREFVEMMAIGAIVALLLAAIPGIGPALAACALSAAAIVALVRELMRMLSQDLH